MVRISYIELPVSAVAGVRDFYAGAFGWDFTDFGPDYASTTTGDVDVGLNGTEDYALTGILPIVEVKADLEGALEKVVAAGGAITQPIFAFPGGRRFHFRDPAGHQLGVFINEPDDGAH
ncbi:MAG: VOC family protein [Pseudomonadota bacterium]